MGMVVSSGCGVYMHIMRIKCEHLRANDIACVYKMLCLHMGVSHLKEENIFAQTYIGFKDYRDLLYNFKHSFYSEN